MNLLVVYFFGILFAIGLGIGGMTQPIKVINFLDIFGNWDPSLAFVIGGAVAVNMVLYRLTIKRSRPILESEFIIPSKRPINQRLIGGSALFGIGWGLSGYCPGPALVSVVTLSAPVLIFAFSMLAGMMLFQMYPAEEPRPQTDTIKDQEKNCG